MVQTGERLVSTDAERYLLVYMIMVLVVVTALVILFFTVFQKRKNKMLFDKIKQQKLFDEELTKSRLEIKEQTLKNVGQELHDNVGQLLSFASMQLNLVSSIASENIKGKVDDTKDVIKNTIEEVRSLSKSLNTDVISNFGLRPSIQNEVDRLNRLKSINANFTVEGDEFELNDANDGIILFRIVQEFFSNTLKYSDAKNLDVKLNYSNDCLWISLSDNGKGFDMDHVEKGSGLINMKSRAQLINTDFNLTTEPDKGVNLELKYPRKLV